MTYDCFSFFNELDILEIRLNTLNEVVDKFILVEAPWTHSGLSKPLYFQENKQRFAPFLDRIIHIIASEPPTSPTLTERENAWIRENWQRNQITRGLTEAKPEDALIIADLDEIPNPKVINSIIQNHSYINNILNLNLRCYAFFLNNHCVSSPIWKGGPQIISYAKFLDNETYKSIICNETCQPTANTIPSATLIRFSPRKKNIKNAGWHLSSMGGVKAIQRKVSSFAHTEFKDISENESNIEQIIMSGKGFFGFGDRFMPEPVFLHLPPHIKQELNSYGHLILKTSVASWYYKAPLRLYYYFVKISYDLLVTIAIMIIPKQLHSSFRKLRKILKL